MNLRFLYLLIFSTTLLNFSQSSEIEFLESLKIFNTDEIVQALQDVNATDDCVRDLIEFQNGLGRGDSWALSMLDSTAKQLDGVLMGNTKFLGHYDECVLAEHPNKTFSGEFCMVNVLLNVPINVTTVKIVRPWQLAVTQDLTLPLAYGICLPSTCAPKDIGSALNWITSQIQNPKIHLSLSLDEGSCRTKEPIPLEDTDWAVIGILIAFGIIALCSTIYDVFKQYQKEKPHLILSSFSIFTNGKQLFHISTAGSQLQCLHGLRFFSMCWVVLCHSYASSLSGAVVNIVDMTKMIKDVNHIFIINGFVSVDSFFFLSGLLVCLIFFRNISKQKYYDVPVSYIHRYLRLTPPFAMMMLIVATLFPYMGDGPLWNTISESGAAPCRKSWWSGLLYVQNFVSPDAMCLGQSWYLSTDMQLYWLSPLLLYPMLLWPVFAPYYILLLVLVVALTNFAVGYIYDLGPTLLMTTSLDQGKVDYVNFWTRAVPYLMGAAVAYIICGIQAKKIKIELTPLYVTIGWLVSAGLCLGSLYGYVPFKDGDYTTVEAAFYLAFHRVAWALGLGWVVFACVQGYGGVVNTFLSWGIFQPLGKLSYCTFLIHMSVQLYRVGAERTSFYAGDLNMIYCFLGDLVLANLLSIPFTLLFEMPFGNIDKFLFQNVKILPLPRPKRFYETKDNNKRDQLNEVVADGDQEKIQ